MAAIKRDMDGARDPGEDESTETRGPYELRCNTNERGTSRRAILAHVLYHVCRLDGTRSREEEPEGGDWRGRSDTSSRQRDLSGNIKNKLQEILEVDDWWAKRTDAERSVPNCVYLTESEEEGESVYLDGEEMKNSRRETYLGMTIAREGLSSER